jgi:uncharacterized protein YkwD
MANCDLCYKSIDGIPFRCRRCHRIFCVHHHLPENHNCPFLRKHPNHFFEHKHGHHHSRNRIRYVPTYPKQIEPEMTESHVNEEITNQRKSWKNSVITKILLLFILLGLVIGSIFYLSSLETVRYLNEQRPATKTKYYNESVSNVISFKQYLENVYQIEGTREEFKAFLKRAIEGSEESGLFIYTLIDDNNNSIKIVGISDKLKEIFPKKGKSEKLYVVSGTFKRDYKTLLFDISDAKETQRDDSGYVTKVRTEEYFENITRTVVQPRYPQLRNVLYYVLDREILCQDGTPRSKCSENKPYLCTFTGLKKDPSNCGCPNGERLYKNNCIKVVKCSDGTFEPECSKNKPKQCLGGSLIDNAILCGCSADSDTIGATCKKIMRCSDGTRYGECSSEKPYFCSGGKLVEDAKLCGCNWGYRSYGGSCIDSDKADSLYALDYINKIRKENGRRALGWDDKLYELARFRAKDMYDRKYFDHVTPDGKCVKDFKTQFGLGKYDIAENAGAVTYGYTSYGIDYASYADSIQQVNGWLESRGHRFNLLYPTHILGAASCYKGACIFLGANMDGFGSGPCATGAEGLAFWENVGTQPGEI